MAAMHARRTLPPGLEPLHDLAVDLRWTWSHRADDLWRSLDPDGWDAAANPWMLLQDVAESRLAALAADPATRGRMDRLDAARREYLADPGWFGRRHPPDALRGVAYFSMEFGLGEALPLYAGGLGVLAGDYLKAASDLGVPAVGVGLLYQEGYFHQAIDTQGTQHELFPYNDPSDLPIEPVPARDGRWLHVALEFPGRLLHVRVWQARVGRVRLYLLDTNDSLNSPVDRAITAKLYTGDPHVQFLQEAVLGIAGWRALEMLDLPIDVCHLNEGHAAMAVLERARSHMVRTGLPFHEALWATRAGNVFTTHTAVAAAYDRFNSAFVAQFLPYLRIYVDRLGIPLEELLALGRARPDDADEPFNLAYLAARASIAVNGVSERHGAVSRALFRGLYPRWPEAEVPVTHVTNGVHMPTWDSPAADRLWEAACGKDRWRGEEAGVGDAIAQASDEALWAVRAEGRRELVEAARRRLARQLGFRGADRATIARVRHVLDPDALTLGFARRFATYKRPTLLLADRARLVRLLTDRARPVQLLVAGKAHARDPAGKEMIRQWVELARDEAVRDRLVFLEDYDLTLAQELVRGVDVWINTPRRPWEACGTSGMKVLVNGGLNVSSLDGWWAEAFAPAVGWAIGDADGGAAADGGDDAAEAAQLYRLLEEEIVPAFHERDARGIPVRWLARVRASMAALTPRFSTNRMVREYVERLYLPAADLLRRRACDDWRPARALAAWHARLARGWDTLAFGAVHVRREGGGLTFAVPVRFGALSPETVRVELYADAAAPGEPPVRVAMVPDDGARDGDGVVHRAHVATHRPASDFTPRLVPYHADARVPAEAWQIHWQR